MVLLVAGFVYALVGFAFLLTPLSEDRAASLRLALHVSDGAIHPWGVAWVLCGAAAVASGRWPAANHKWGYVALGGLAALWGSFYLLGIWFLDSPATGYSGALVWFLVAFLWWAISGLDNPDDVSVSG